MAPSGRTVTLVSTYEAAALAAPLLSSSQILLVDCEGHNLGHPHPSGALTLLSLGTLRTHVVLLDVLALPDPSHPALAPLLALLSNPAVLKVFWDGRTDALELRETYGVAVKGVLDLQLVDVVARARRMNPAQRRADLARRYFKPIQGAIEEDPDAFWGIHQLSGLDQCVRVLGLARGEPKDETVVAMHRTDGGAQWRQRPLDARLLAYAAHDIELIARVYRHYVTEQAWVKKGRKLEVLRAQSARYVALYGSREMKVRHEELGTARFMTMGVIDERESEHGGRGEERTYVCERCEVGLAERCYAVAERQETQRWSICRLCCAIMRRNREVDDGRWVG
ncbi:ribonuclease H-like domain-containing protein [Earliella scabrosa]|nr:ribonuclease H-like domain-containing protein [Earliella scabrosa]